MLVLGVLVPALLLVLPSVVSLIVLPLMLVSVALVFVELVLIVLAFAMRGAIRCVGGVHHAGVAFIVWVWYISRGVRHMSVAFIVAGVVLRGHALCPKRRNKFRKSWERIVWGKK